jgi:hypothetical protein
MADTNAALLLPAPGGAADTNSAELRGIKGPVEIPNSYAWIAWLLGALILGAILWKLWQKYRKKTVAAKPAIVIPAHRKAKDRLRTASELMSDPYAFCSLVSNVVRSYIEDRFNLHAPDRTTEEFMDELRVSTQLHADHKRLLEEFLTQCDLVKFARHEPTVPELQALLDAALRFVDETTVTEQPAVPPESTKLDAAA